MNLFFVHSDAHSVPKDELEFWNNFKFWRLQCWWRSFQHSSKIIFCMINRKSWKIYKFFDFFLPSALKKKPLKWSLKHFKSEVKSKSPTLQIKKRGTRLGLRLQNRARHPPWQGGILPTELYLQTFWVF